MSFRPWQRERHPGPAGALPDRTAHLAFIALLDDARIDGALTRARAAVDDDAAWDALDLAVRTRSVDGGHLDEALSGRAAHGLELLDEHVRREVDRCPRYLDLGATLEDPRSLVVLQAALALLAALAVEGDLLLALDRPTARWWSPDELLALPADRGFEIDEHVRVVVEAVERRPGVGHVVRSRGLEKFARPDVAARVPRRHAERVSEIVRDVARLLGEGERLEPHSRLHILAAPPLTLIPRTDDCLADAAPATAPLYELRDCDDAGRPAPALDRLFASQPPRRRLLNVLK